MTLLHPYGARWYSARQVINNTIWSISESNGHAFDWYMLTFILGMKQKSGI